MWMQWIFSTFNSCVFIFFRTFLLTKLKEKYIRKPLDLETVRCILKDICADLAICIVDSERNLNSLKCTLNTLRRDYSKSARAGEVGNKRHSLKIVLRWPRDAKRATGCGESRIQLNMMIYYKSCMKRGKWPEVGFRNVKIRIKIWEHNSQNQGYMYWQRKYYCQVTEEKVQFINKNASVASEKAAAWNLQRKAEVCAWAWNEAYFCALLLIE